MSRPGRLALFPAGPRGSPSVSRLPVTPLAASGPHLCLCRDLRHGAKGDPRLLKLICFTVARRAGRRSSLPTCLSPCTEEARQPGLESPPGSRVLTGAVAGTPPALRGLGLATPGKAAEGRPIRGRAARGELRCRVRPCHPVRAKVSLLGGSPSPPCPPCPPGWGPSHLRCEGSVLSRGSLRPSRLQVL